MSPDAAILGFDTSGPHCAAALLVGDRIAASRAEAAERGQVSRLMPLLEDVLGEGGADWRDLARIGVGVGPGNFTGTRISVSAARGLAMALDIPAIGVSAFDVAESAAAQPGIPAVEGPGGQIYVRPPGAPPRLADSAQAAALGLPLIHPPEPEALACAIARLAAAADANAPPPAPLYVKPADAAPAKRPPAPLLPDDG